MFVNLGSFLVLGADIGSRLEDPRLPRASQRRTLWQGSGLHRFSISLASRESLWRRFGGDFATLAENMGIGLGSSFLTVFLKETLPSWDSTCAKTIVNTMVFV